MKELTFLTLGFVLGTIFMKCRNDGKALKKEVEALRARANPTV